MNDVLTFEYEGEPYITVDDKRVIRIRWGNLSKLSLMERHRILQAQFVYTSPKKVDFLFRLPVFNRICDFVRSKMPISYSDIECYIVARFCNLEGAVPGFGQPNDHDSYCNFIRIACDREMRKYESSHGSRCWDYEF